MRTWAPRAPTANVRPSRTRTRARWCRPSAWTPWRSPGTAPCCCCPAGAFPLARPAGVGGALGGSRRSQSLRRTPGRGRGAARRVLMRRRGGDLTGAQGFVVTVLALVTQRETRSSGRVLTWPRGAGGLSLLSAAPRECVRLLRALGSGTACSLGSLGEAASRKCHVFLCRLCPRGLGCAWGSGSAVGVTVGRMVSGSVGWLPASRLPAGSGCSILAAPGIICFSLSCPGAERAVLTWVSQQPDGQRLAGTLPRGDPLPCRLVPLC